MAQIISNGYKFAYGLKKFVVDTVEEIKKIPLLSTTLPGSTIFVTSDSSRYILTQEREWAKIISTSAAGGSGGDDSGGGGDNGSGDSGSTPGDDEIVYDGTEI